MVRSQCKRVASPSGMEEWDETTLTPSCSRIAAALPTLSHFSPVARNGSRLRTSPAA